MVHTENDRLQNDLQGWRECRANLEEMVESCGFELQRLQQEAQASLGSLCWPNGVCCPFPFCGSANVQASANHDQMPYVCLGCQRPFAATSATVLNFIKLDDLRLLAATYVTVAHQGLVRPTPLAEWLPTEEPTARLLLGLIEKGIAGVLPANDDEDAVAQTLRVLAFMLRGDREDPGVVVAATGVGLDWRRVLHQLDPVLQFRSEPTLPGIGPRVVARPSAEPARKKSKSRQPRPPAPKARGMRPDQMMIPFFTARVRLESGAE